MVTIKICVVTYKGIITDNYVQEHDTSKETPKKKVIISYVTNVFVQCSGDELMESVFSFLNISGNNDFKEMRSVYIPVICFLEDGLKFSSNITRTIWLLP